MTDLGPAIHRHRRASAYRAVGIVIMLVALVAARPGPSASGVVSASASTGTTSLVSVTTAGEQGNGDSHLGYSVCLSADSHYVAFESVAGNLVSGDTNECSDVFVHDRDTGATRRVSVATGGVQGNGDSHSAAISADGRYVAFASDADNLVTGDTNACTDVFVRDLDAGTTTRVSVATGGAEAGSASYAPSISADGRLVAFQSEASDLAAGDTNGSADIFVRDREAGTTTRVSVSTGGAEADGDSYSAAISGDGRYVAFESVAGDLVADDTNAMWDVFVHGRDAGTTTRASVATGGAQATSNSYSAAISDDGRYVAFASDATDLVADDTNLCTDIFLWDRDLGTTVRLSVSESGAEGDQSSSDPAISGDGRHVTFESQAANLVAGDLNAWADIFVCDREAAAITLASVATDGTQGDNVSFAPSISGDGRHVTFSSTGTNLVWADKNGHDDVFVHDMNTAPVAVDDSYSAVAGVVLTVEAPGVLENDSDADGGALTAVKVTDPAHGDLTWGDWNDGSFTYAPDPGWTGTDSFTYVASDGLAESNVATITITVAPAAIAIENSDVGVTFSRYFTALSPSYSGGSYTYAYSRAPFVGTRLEAKFYGSRVKWIGPMQPNYGRAKVYVDGVYKATVSCYAAAGTLSSVIYDSGTLPSDGWHSVWIEIADGKDVASTGYVVVIDKFEVSGSAPKDAGTRYGEDDGTFVGSWVVVTGNPTFTDSTYAYSYWKGARFVMTFTGTRVAWIGPKVNNYGRAAVYVDGVYKTTVSQYSPGTGTAFRARVWESAWLSTGNHTLEIRPLGIKEPASLGTVVVVDGIDVTP